MGRKFSICPAPFPLDAPGGKMEPEDVCVYEFDLFHFL